MKRWIIALLCLAALTGCTNAPVEEGVQPSEPAVMSDQAEVLPEEAAEEVTYITDEEITALIDAYLLYEEYTVYSSDSMETAATSTTVLGNGLVVEEIEVTDYNKVVNENYDTWAEWTGFVESIFSGDALTAEMEQMENDQRFIDIDGYTYCRLGSMGWYVSSEYTYQITESSTDRVVIEMTRQEVEPGEYETKDYINIFALHLTENGWRIGEWIQ